MLADGVPSAQKDVERSAYRTIWSRTKCRQQKFLRASYRNTDLYVLNSAQILKNTKIRIQSEKKTEQYSKKIPIGNETIYEK